MMKALKNRVLENSRCTGYGAFLKDFERLETAASMCGLCQIRAEPCWKSWGSFPTTSFPHTSNAIRLGGSTRLWGTAYEVPEVPPLLPAHGGPNVLTQECFEMKRKVEVRNAKG